MHFEEFLNRRGEVIGRFAPRTTPNSPETLSAVETACADGDPIENYREFATALTETHMSASPTG